MDHNGLSSHRKDMKHKGRNVVWSVAMDKCLIETLVIQARNGNKFDKCYNETAYTAACFAVNSHFGLNLNNQKVVNRLKTIKKRFRTMGDILNQDGFTWNPHTKMIECDNENRWKRYIMAHPDAKGFLNKQIEMYEELKIICGNYEAPTRWGRIDGNQQYEIKHEEDSRSFVSTSSEHQSKTEDTESFTDQPDYIQMPNCSDEAPVNNPPHRQLPKRPHSPDSIQDAMLTVASSIRRLADALDRSKNCIDPHELLQAVMEIDELEESKQMYAFEYLNAEPTKARAFMTYNVRMRKIYLFRQFWWWK